MNAILHTFYMMHRHNMALLRQPVYIAFSLVQPIIWLLLYGQLFRRVTDLPGFQTTSYINFLTPGIVVMSAFFSAGWTGMGIIHEINRGIMDRFLVSPASRFAIIAGRLSQLGGTIVLQALILLTLGFILGARYQGGIVGLLVLIASAVLLATAIGALSCALALVVRKEESVIAASNFILLPLTFLSPVFMAKALMPDWIRTVSQFNPVNWSVEAGRAAMQPGPDWTLVLTRMAFLVAFGLFSAWLATRAFRSYQRSV